jgi:hypothetical protein
VVTLCGRKAARPACMVAEQTISRHLSISIKNLPFHER